MQNLVFGIIFVRAPSEIAESIIGWITIVVASNHSARPKTNKSFKNHNMDSCPLFDARLSEIAIHVATLLPLLKDLTLLKRNAIASDALRPVKASDLAKR